ncbi:hypothetical protein OKW34_003206 [Paraburkholderia youngii]
MDAPDTALGGQNTTAGGRLYMAFELGERSWKLSLGDGRRAPSRYTVAAGDTTVVLTAIANARAHCHLGADAPVYSCYEAGRDGFWLHRWLSEQGIVNLVVDSASIEVNRRARRAKTDRLDSCHLPPYRGHRASGIKEPGRFRHKGATSFPAYRSQLVFGIRSQGRNRASRS